MVIGEIVVGAEGLVVVDVVVVDVSVDETLSSGSIRSGSIVVETASGEMPTATPRIGIIKTLRAFNFL